MPEWVIALLVVSAVVSVAATGYGVVEQGKATDRAKDAAERQAQIQKDRLGNEAKFRELQNQRTLEKNRRTARNKRSAIRNKAAIQNIDPFPFTRAVSTREEDNRSFIKKAEALAQIADKSTAQQIDLSQKTKIQSAEDAFTGALIGGIASTAQTIGSTAFAIGGAGEDPLDFDHGIIGADRGIR
jgi:hypothetical protein